MVRTHDHFFRPPKIGLTPTGLFDVFLVVIAPMNDGDGGSPAADDAPTAAAARTVVSLINPSSVIMVVMTACI